MVSEGAADVLLLFYTMRFMCITEPTIIKSKMMTKSGKHCGAIGPNSQLRFHVKRIKNLLVSLLISLLVS